MSEKTDRESFGQIGYEAYGETAQPLPWTTFDGRPMPTWEQLGATGTGMETRRRWEVAGTAINVAVGIRDMEEEEASAERLSAEAPRG
jgi:hypothetical protein